MTTPIKAVRTTIKLGDIELDGYRLPCGQYKMSREGLRVLDILLGNSTGKKYAKPLVQADNPHGKLTKIEGNSASAKLISLVVLGILIGDSTGKKYAKPILEADKSSRELTKIQGQSASAKLISLDTFAAIVIEGVAARLIDAEDIEPLEACKKAISIMHAKTLGYQ